MSDLLPKTVAGTVRTSSTPISQDGHRVAPGSDTRESVSVIIPVYGDWFPVKRCIESLKPKNGRKFQVFLVDDGSPRPIAEQLELPGVHHFRLETNNGPCHALNRGLEKTTDQWIVVLNSDVQAGPGSLERLIEALEERPEYDFAVAKLLQDKDPFAVDSAGDGLLLGGGGYRIGHGEADHTQAGDPRAVLSAAGTACAYRRTVLESIGGFDEDFFGFLEDLDVSLRACLNGYRCLYVPSAIVYHQGGATFETKGMKEIFRLITRNQIWVVAKNYPASVFLRALPRIVLFQLLWLSLMSSRGFAGPYLRGLWGALCGLPRMLRKRRQIQRHRKITPRQFWQMLKQSEGEIAAWQRRLVPAERSLLLRIYFSLFNSNTAESLPHA